MQNLCQPCASQKAFIAPLFLSLTYKKINMATIGIELSGKPNKDQKEHLIMLRITVNRKRSRIGLIYSVIPNQFNPKGRGSKHIGPSHPEHARINGYLMGKILLAKDVVSKLEKEGKAITPQIIKTKILQPKTYDLFVFAETIKTELLSQGNIGNYKKYRTILNSLKDFVKKPELFFDEIDLDFLNRYQIHLKSEERKQTTIHGYVGRIRSLFNKAILRGLVEPAVSPFINYKIKQGKPSKERLNLEEIQKIENLVIKNTTLMWHVKNTFLFAFYNAGIRISDILLMKWDNIKEGRLIYTMYKTNKLHSLILKDKPLEIF